MSISFIVPGRPVPKKRPRVAYRRRGVVTYTPKETKDYEEAVGWAARPHFPRPLEGPVKLTIRIFLSGRRNEPDCTNIVKAVEDGCNGIVYVDDRQVKELHAYVLHDEEERVEVEVAESVRIAGR